MRIGAYQFPVTGKPGENLAHMEKGIAQAKDAGAELLVFPECAVTGYPVLSYPSIAEADLVGAEVAHARIRALAAASGITVITGTIRRQGDACYNDAAVFCPNGRTEHYCKRALWGWDAENFTAGPEKDGNGVFSVGPLKVGVRICFETRFPEYFRELLRAGTDLNVIMFFDVTEEADPEQYEVMKGHVRSRAAENACPVLSVNTYSRYQTAPTALFSASGRVLAELEPCREGLLIYDFEPQELTFSEQGRRAVAGRILGL